jgi:hypothetical protein
MLTRMQKPAEKLLLGVQRRLLLCKDTVQLSATWHFYMLPPDCTCSHYTSLHP